MAGDCVLSTNEPRLRFPQCCHSSCVCVSVCVFVCVSQTSEGVQPVYPTWG